MNPVKIKQYFFPNDKSLVKMRDILTFGVDNYEANLMANLLKNVITTTPLDDVETTSINFCNANLSVQFTTTSIGRLNNSNIRKRKLMDENNVNSKKVNRGESSMVILEGHNESSVI